MPDIKGTIFNSKNQLIKATSPTCAHPPCFCLVFSPTYTSLCLLLFGKWLPWSRVMGHNQAKHISLRPRRATLMVKLGLERREEPARSSHCVSVWPRECHSCPRPLLVRPCPSSTHAHTQLLLHYPALSSPVTWYIGRDIHRLAPVHRHPPG